jgi:hypothetical protein
MVPEELMICQDFGICLGNGFFLRVTLIVLIGCGFAGLVYCVHVGANWLADRFDALVLRIIAARAEKKDGR